LFVRRGLGWPRMFSTMGYPPYLHMGQRLTMSRAVAFGTETSYTSRHLTGADFLGRFGRLVGTQGSPSGARVVGMNLVACEAPGGALDAAPPTALRQDSLTERWAGFWGTDDRYYARCTTTSGDGSVRESWFCFTDEVAAEQGEAGVVHVLPRLLTRQRRRTLLYRVGRSASHGCVFGVRRPMTRATALRA
jgi:hypothetical protein